MRGRTLLDLLDDFRAEARLSLNPAQNAQDREAQVKLLQRTQDDYWEDFDWPHLRVERQVPVQAGQRFYDVPSDLPLDRIEKIEVFSSGIWQALCAEIGPEQYAAWNSDLDQRSFPPRRWKIWETEQIEVWPIADRDADTVTLDGMLKFTGIRYLNRLVDDDDVADLDNRLIVITAAAERLAASGSKDAGLKQTKATQRYAKLRGGLMPHKRFRLFGTTRPENRSTRAIVAGAYVQPTTPSVPYPPDPVGYIVDVEQF
jgi:hypothetical protein